MENEIKSLVKENEQVKKRLDHLERTVNTYNDAFKELIYRIQALGDIISQNLDRDGREYTLIVSMLNNLRFEILDVNPEQSEYFYPNIVDEEQAIQKIIDEKNSLGRFGDGEFAIMSGSCRHSFQCMDAELSKRLNEVISTNLPNFMIGVANNYGNLEKYTDHAADGIRVYLQPSVRREQMHILSKSKVYYDTYLTRPYVIYRDKFTEAPLKRFNHLKEIWQDRNIIMVEGAQTRLGVGNDLFDNSASIHRIVAPATNSYSRYKEVLETALSYAQKDILFLIAIGPSAAVLAFDIAQKGYQALDVGHIDIEYEWFLMGTGERENIKNKYTNEVLGLEKAEDIDDPVYESQILASFE